MQPRKPGCLAKIHSTPLPFHFHSSFLLPRDHRTFFPAIPDSLTPPVSSQPKDRSPRNEGTFRETTNPMQENPAEQNQGSGSLRGGLSPGQEVYRGRKTRRPSVRGGFAPPPSIHVMWSRTPHETLPSAGRLELEAHHHHHDVVLVVVYVLVRTPFLVLVGNTHVPRELH